MSNLDLSEIGIIVYSSAHVLALVCASGYILCNYDGTLLEKLKYLWKTKWIYTSLLTKIYDQATDIGVAIYWYELAQKEHRQSRDSFDIPHLDMNILFWLCIGILVLSRVVTAGVIVLHWGNKDGLLALIDGYIIYKIYIAVVKEYKTKPTDEIRHAQLFEVILEAVPQIILQSLFIIRTNNYFETSIIVFISLGFSMIAASSKYIAWDAELEQFDEFIRTPQISAHCPMINIGYLARIFWRICDLISRLCLYVLLWSVVGGIFIFIFVLFIFIGYYIHTWCFHHYEIQHSTHTELLLKFLLYHLLGTIWDAGTNDDINAQRWVLHHFCENIVVLIIVLIFAGLKFDCDYNICANPDTRRIEINSYVLAYICVFVACIVFGIISFYLIPLLQAHAQRWKDARKEAKTKAKQNKVKNSRGSKNICDNNTENKHSQNNSNNCSEDKRASSTKTVANDVEIAMYINDTSSKNRKKTESIKIKSNRDARLTQPYESPNFGPMAHRLSGGLPKEPSFI